MTAPAIDLTAVARARVALRALVAVHPELAEPAAMVRLTTYLHRDDIDENLSDTTMNDAITTFTARLPAPLLKSLDKEAKRLGKLAGGITVSRNDALRVTLERALAAAAPTNAPEALSARRAVDRTPAPAPSSGENAVRERYRCAYDGGKVKGKPTAEAIGCTEAMLRRWRGSDANRLPPRALEKLAALLEREGL